MSSPAAPPVDAPPQRVDPAALTSDFMDSLFGYVPPELHALLWTLQDKRSTWVPLDAGPQPVADRARALADGGKDVYVAVSVARAPGLHDTRIKSANASGIMGLWADIDIADPDVHKKWNLPPTVDAALDLLAAAQMEPTLIVHSGHGLQAWWLFNEFWSFESEDDRLAAAGLAQRWNNTLQFRAAERQWVVDSTFDLARVMRVPGTLNRKGDPVMPVRLLHVNGPRYNPDTFDDYCVDEAYMRQQGLSSARSYQPDKLDLSEADRLDFELLQALLDNDDQFKASYDMKRKDFTDQSPSSYDLSLATQAARAGWPDAQIARLIFQFRKRHRLDTTKALRVDYINRTISRARDGLARDEAAEAIDEVGEALSEAKASGDPEREKSTRRSALDVIGQQVGMELIHFIKYASEPPAYAAVTPTGMIPLGGTDGFLRWDKFRQACAGYANVLIPRFKPAQWDRICELILKAVEEQDVGAEATERGEVSAWLSQYLAQRPPVDTVEEAATSEYPYVDSDRVVLFGPAFKRWLWLTYQERLTNKDMGRRLRAFGCEPDKINVDVDGKRTSRGIWRLPAGVGT